MGITTESIGSSYVGGLLFGAGLLTAAAIFKILLKFSFC